jgi:hypothetical protein
MFVLISQGDSMTFKRGLSLLPFVLAGQGLALDISGKVVDKFEKTLAGARVCVQGGQPCAVSGADGTFRLTGSAGVHGASFQGLGFALELKGAKLSLTSPRAADAVVEWRDASGRALAPDQRVALAQGINSFALPASLPRLGLVFVRVRGAGFSVAWKGILDGASGEARHQALAAFAKVASAPMLEATMDGMGSRTYKPAAETETNVVIMLPRVNEISIFDGTMKGWGGNMANWQIKNGNIYGKGSGGQQLITDGNYGNFRLFIRFRSFNGQSHLGILFWGKRQFGYQGSDAHCVMPHDGGQWDYHSSGGGGVPHQSPPPKAKSIDQKLWHLTELVASRDNKTFQMATNGIWMINHKYSLSTLEGPIGLQLHDGTVEFEAKDVFVEVNPANPEKLLSVP